MTDRRVWIRIVIGGFIMAGLSGCMTPGQATREVSVDEALTIQPAPNVPPAEAQPPQPQPGFEQESPKAQGP